MNELRIPLPDSPDLLAITPDWLVSAVQQTFPEWLLKSLLPYGVWVINNPVWSCVIAFLITTLIFGILDSLKTRKLVAYLEKHPEHIARIWAEGPVVMGRQEAHDRVCVRTTDGREHVVGWYSNAPVVEDRLYKALRKHRNQ